MTTARPLIVGLLAALAGVASAPPSVAQTGPRIERAGALQVEGVDVEQVARLAAGVPLNFSVYGSPGAAALLRIDGARVPLDLQERQPGVYEGTYVIGAGDRIRAESRVTATLQRGGQAVHAALEESLQLARGDASALDPALAEQEPLERVGPVQAVERVDRVGPVGRFDRVERLDRDDRFDRVERVGPVERSQRTGARVPPPVSVAESACAACAVVESIRRPASAEGPGNLGAVSGTLIGAVFGERAREAHMRRIARIHGTVTGALTGRGAAGEASAGYEVVFRLPDGSIQTHRFPTAPALQVGDSVRLDGPGGAAPGRAPAPLR